MAGDHRLAKNQVALKCAALPSTTISYYSLFELENAPDESGWYAWFYVPDSIEELKLELFRLSGVRASVKGILGLEFEGDLAVKGMTTPDLKPEDLAALQRSMLAFSPPLYIGIAKKLRARLLQHRSRVNESVASEPEAAPDATAPPDTDEESSYFGGRIGSLLARNGMSSASLYVKCVTATDPQQLKRVETLLNRLYSPAFGRRA